MADGGRAEREFRGGARHAPVLHDSGEHMEEVQVNLTTDLHVRPTFRDPWWFGRDRWNPSVASGSNHKPLIWWINFSKRMGTTGFG